MSVYERIVKYATKAYEIGTIMGAGYEFFRAADFYSNDSPEAAAGTAAMGAILLFAASLPSLVKRQNRIDRQRIQEMKLNDDPKVIHIDTARKREPLETITRKASRQ